MNSILLKNGTIVTMTNKIIEHGGILIKGNLIEKIYTEDELKKSEIQADRVIDVSNKLVMPGFICSHHHLYSTMSCGMAIPGEPASNFVETLERLWWRLDMNLNDNDVYLSSLIPLIQCIRKGTTTIIDHHASPGALDGSLDIIRKGIEQSGIRASLCYEVSDRNKEGEGISENKRFLESLKNNPSDLVTGMVGLHASFTVNDDTVKKCVELAKSYDVGCHIHVAEAESDRNHSMKSYGVPIIKRLHNLGMTGEKSIFVHCVWIDEEEMELLKDTGTIVVHNPESNMNNAVGTSKVLKMLEKDILVGLGTDGMSSDMLQQMRCAYLLHRLDNKDPRVAFMEIPQMLLDNNREIAKRILGIKTGILAENMPADVIVVDYNPHTPLNTDNFLGHLIFGIVNSTVDSTIVNGQILMENKVLKTLDEESICAESRDAAVKFWNRFQENPWKK